MAERYEKFVKELSDRDIISVLTYGIIDGNISYGQGKKLEDEILRRMENDKGDETKIKENAIEKEPFEKGDRVNVIGRKNWGAGTVETVDIDTIWVRFDKSKNLCAMAPRILKLIDIEQE